MQLRTDLAIEARELAGGRVAGMDYREYRENQPKISRLSVKSSRAKQLLGNDVGT